MKPIETKLINKDKPFRYEPHGQMIQIRKLALHNFAHKFVDQPVPPDSPYIEVNSNPKQREIYLKRSIVWLLRPDEIKLSSDTLVRVKTASSTVKPIKSRQPKKSQH